MLSLYDCIHAYMHTNNSALYSQCQQGHTVKFWVLLGMLQLRDGPKWSKLQGKYWKSQANSNLIITLRTKHQSHNNCPSADIKEWVLSFLLCRICSVFVWQPSVAWFTHEACQSSVGPKEYVHSTKIKTMWISSVLKVVYVKKLAMQNLLCRICSVFVWQPSVAWFTHEACQSSVGPKEYVNSTKIKTMWISSILKVVYVKKLATPSTIPLFSWKTFWDQNSNNKNTSSFSISSYPAGEKVNVEFTLTVWLFVQECMKVAVFFITSSW